MNQPDTRLPFAPINHQDYERVEEEATLESKLVGCALFGAIGAAAIWPGSDLRSEIQHATVGSGLVVAGFAGYAVVKNIFSAVRSRFQ